MKRFSTVSDDVLLHDLHAMVGSHRRVTAELILHLGEMDARRLHVEKGFSSLFSYCVELLHFSEDEACRRIEAARLARRFPAIYPLLETAAVSLTVLGLLKSHLTDHNHRELLAGVSGSNVRQAKEWLAARFPQPDVPSSIRKQAERRVALVLPCGNVGQALPPPGALQPRHGVATPALAVKLEVPTPTEAVEPKPFRGSLSPASPQARVEPLSQDRFLVKFTANRAVKEKLEVARDLMRHVDPRGELAVVLERALDLLILDLQKKKHGRTDRTRSNGPRVAKATHVTRAARREVVDRDGWRCSFVAEGGRRCGAQGFLEFDHKTPKGRGGSSEVENLRVLCRPHNRWAAELAYGAAHIARAISDSRGGRSRSDASSLARTRTEPRSDAMPPEADCALP